MRREIFGGEMSEWVFMKYLPADKIVIYFWVCGEMKNGLFTIG